MKFRLMGWTVLVGMLLLAAQGFCAAALEQTGLEHLADSPLGFAIVDSLGQNGVTGGGRGKAVVVTDFAELRKYAASPEPLTIFIKGTISGQSDLQVASNKTLIGMGADATIKGAGIKADNAYNIIIRNLTITEVSRSSDAIALRGCHHVWIDHCELTGASDGLLDFTIGSDYLTVSWTIFRNHDKVSLLNSGTNHPEDYGKNKGTFYGNWFDNTVQRNPRIGYGLGHIFNNYYSNITSYAIGTHTRARVLAENNYFLNVNNPFSQMYSGNDWDANYGDIESRGNIFDKSRGITTGTGRSFDPGFYYEYAFALSEAAAVPGLIMEKAGPGEEYGHLIIPVPGNGAVDVAEGDLELAWFDTREVEAWQVYLGTDAGLDYLGTVTEPSFQLSNLQPDTVYFWRVDAVTAQGTITGSVWRFKTVPARASKPLPQDGSIAAPFDQLNATTVKPVELSWVPGLNAVAHDVYLGTGEQLGSGDYLGRAVKNVYAPGRLQLGTTYFWRVDSVLPDGSIVEGEVWCFALPIAYAKAGRLEAEDMVVGGRYFREFHSRGGALDVSNQWVMKIEAGAGSLSAVWSDPDTVCDISIAYLDQSTGVGTIALYVNDTLIDRFLANQNTDRIMVRTIPSVRLRTGDEVRIEANSQSKMLTRIDYLEFKPAAKQGD